MSKSPRKIVCRDFKNAEGIFLNYDTQVNVQLGDVFLWDGKNAQFNIVTRLKDLGIPPTIERNLVPENKLYTSGRGVSGKFCIATDDKNASMSFNFTASSRYSMQASDTYLEELDEVSLANDIVKAEENGKLDWDKNWIVVAKIWDAAAFTKFVSANSGAYATVEATSASLLSSFNIADVDLGIGLAGYHGLAAHQFAESGARPFFMGMKLRKRSGAIPHMVKYG